MDDASLAIQRSMERDTQQAKQNIARLEVQLRALNPRAVLVRGYSITRNSRGQVLRTVSGMRPGDKVTTILSHGEFESEVAKMNDSKEDANT